jgi:ABC-type branched-subunit amino acid transport system ATPase component
MNTSVIEVKDFRKTYGDVVAVDGISFNVNLSRLTHSITLSGYDISSFFFYTASIIIRQFRIKRRYIV